MRHLDNIMQHFASNPWWISPAKRIHNKRKTVRVSKLSCNWEAHIRVTRTHLKTRFRSWTKIKMKDEPFSEYRVPYHSRRGFSGRIFSQEHTTLRAALAEAWHKSAQMSPMFLRWFASQEDRISMGYKLSRSDYGRTLRHEEGLKIIPGLGHVHDYPIQVVIDKFDGIRLINEKPSISNSFTRRSPWHYKKENKIIIQILFLRGEFSHMVDCCPNTLQLHRTQLKQT